VIVNGLCESEGGGVLAGRHSRLILGEKRITAAIVGKSLSHGIAGSCRGVGYGLIRIRRGSE